MWMSMDIAGSVLLTEDIARRQSDAIPTVPSISCIRAAVF